MMHALTLYENRSAVSQSHHRNYQLTVERQASSSEIDINNQESNAPNDVNICLNRVIWLLRIGGVIYSRNLDKINERLKYIVEKIYCIFSPIMILFPLGLCFTLRLPTKLSSFSDALLYEINYIIFYLWALGNELSMLWASWRSLPVFVHRLRQLHRSRHYQV